MGRDEAEAAAWKGNVPSSTVGRGNPRPHRRLGSIPGASAPGLARHHSLRLFWKLPVSPLLFRPAHPSRPPELEHLLHPGGGHPGQQPRGGSRVPQPPPPPCKPPRGALPLRWPQPCGPLPPLSLPYPWPLPIVTVLSPGRCKAFPVEKLWLARPRALQLRSPGQRPSRVLGTSSTPAPPGPSLPGPSS